MRSASAMKSREFKVSKPTDSIAYQRICEELKTSKDLLRQTKRDFEASQERETQLRMRVHVLEDALEFRSEEIGLSGHSDLLAKVAKLRAEVVALKSELCEKQKSLPDYKPDLCTDHNTLRHQIEDIKERLSQSQHETFRLRNGDASEMLAIAERERDKLLEFVRGDMEKSTALAKQVEQLEFDLRAAKRKQQITEETVTSLENSLSAERSKAKQLEAQHRETILQIQELMRAKQLLVSDKENIAHQLDRRSLESDELNKMQMNLFLQLQSKDEELMKKTSELLEVKDRVREAGLTLPSLESDNQRLKERLQMTLDEIAILRDSVAVLEPKLARMEPELTSLRLERAQWYKEKIRIETELNQIRPSGRILNDISRELQQLNELSTATTTSDSKKQQQLSNTAAFSSSSHSTGAAIATNKRMFQTSNSSKDSGHYVNSVADFDNDTSSTTTTTAAPVSLSQRHALWIGLPSIRALNSTLYENIRRLAQDLHSKECQCEELQHALQHGKLESALKAKESEAQRLHVAQQLESAVQTIARLNKLTESNEEEQKRLHQSRIALDQIRIVLTSYPGSFAELVGMKIQRHRPTAVNNNSNDGGVSCGGGGGVSNDSNDAENYNNSFNATANKINNNNNSYYNTASSSSRSSSPLATPMLRRSGSSNIDNNNNHNHSSNNNSSDRQLLPRNTTSPYCNNNSNNNNRAETNGDNNDGKNIGEFSSSSSSSSEELEKKAAAALAELSDHCLPDIVGRALMYNASAVIELRTARNKLHSIEDQYTALTHDYQLLKRAKLEDEHRLHTLQDTLYDVQSKLEATEQTCYDRVDNAAELAEKQNALSITLEAKIESLQRDRQLKAAQVTALQQREASIRAKLFAVLQEYSMKAGLEPPPPSESSKLVDLIQYNIDILRRAMTLIVLSSVTTLANSSGSGSGGSTLMSTTTQQQQHYRKPILTVDNHHHRYHRSDHHSNSMDDGNNSDNDHYHHINSKSARTGIYISPPRNNNNSNNIEHQQQQLYYKIHNDPFVENNNNISRNNKDKQHSADNTTTTSTVIKPTLSYSADFSPESRKPLLGNIISSSSSRRNGRSNIGNISSNNSRDGIIRSPSADSAIRRPITDIHSSSSNSFHGESTTSTPAAAAVSSATNPNNYSNLLLRRSVDDIQSQSLSFNSSIQKRAGVNTGDNINPLQERLRQAQKAFAAMRESR